MGIRSRLLTIRIAVPLTILFIAAVILISAFSTPVLADDTLISGTVSAAEGGSLDGLVLIEKGRLYGKNFRYGGLIEKGTFSVQVDGGGSYGLHLYATGYIYFPLGIRVDEGKDNHGSYKLPPNPALEMAPVIESIRFETSENGTMITAEVTDPNHDLSHQVLAFNAVTGEGFRMDPPGLILPFTKKYPEGTYTLDYSNRNSINSRNWYFVAADNKCYNSPVTGYPFTQEGFMKAKAPGKVSGGKSVQTGQDLPNGREIYRDNCSMCHLTDSGKDKVGPGLKGLFSMDRTPVLGEPVTDEAIRSQILQGGKNMPPYSHLTESEVSAVIQYLKSL
jgi:cytochrome c5